MEHEIRLSQNAQEDEALSKSVAEFLASMTHGLEEEVARVIKEGVVIGEGRTAKVLDLKETIGSPCELCAKIWRNQPRRELSPAGYRGIQFVSPEQEFQIQDELYRAGCRVPRPIAYIKVGDRDVMVMERIRGYDLEKIMAAGARIEEPVWKELLDALIEIKNNGVVHRDIKPANIMLETSDVLEKDALLRGKIKFIDFGVSGRFMGKTPTTEDFKEEVGRTMINYPSDIQRVEALNPKNHRGGPFLK